MPVPSAVIRPAIAVVIAAVVSGDAGNAQARDLLSSFFDFLSGRSQSLPAFGDSDPRMPRQAPSSGGGGRGTAYCVRSCDGRYFPVSASSEQSHAAACSSLCPAGDTRVFYGGSIARATSEDGKPYSSLPNAFKYREQLVSGCTCNGKDSTGLASIGVDEDKTLRRGDIVAGESGLIVASRAAEQRRGAVAEFSPAPPQIRERYSRPQVPSR
ncbi:DUF2865 domain-containing protein [Bradyrhizobium sp. LHD-71]|uniref:DUF2865 domain-containing protein n=1 Tax=Bradyrhizobium sp. LHD-71 TaxID=3072141 RepID=UPI00280EF350|nr:DUF2865 domain-containing protein [Bradyrhizobium sp. LHD-71]MDQ8727043.1 DUF2865 domain-containing protein [Bradyrhizobium sp. LHD-71]